MFMLIIYIYICKYYVHVKDIYMCVSIMFMLRIYICKYYVHVKDIYINDMVEKLALLGIMEEQRVGNLSLSQFFAGRPA